MRIFVGVAWPYANGPLHLGHIAGAYLPADIFARFNRLKGNKVLMVSGSDQHGTPITIRAEREGKSPREIVEKYHAEFLECWEKLGISFDLFTSTGTDNHKKTVYSFFLTLYDKGYIYRKKTLQLYCEGCERFLPDRYVGGRCPFCGSEDARGDQCDVCGKPLNPDELIEPRCSICGGRPEKRETEHFFFKLSAFEKKLEEWIKSKEWKPNVYEMSMRYIREGLRDRAITRDIEWGVEVPIAGYENKRIYVWFEAVIGYLSATKEWAEKNGEDWREFWQGDSRSYYFIGKDNIPFHTLIWPAMLMGYGGLNLPYDVPANEFLTLEGRQFSTSRGWALWVLDFLKEYDPDPLRYALSIGMPETGDADFSISEFKRRNNDELLATYGNLAQRVLTFVRRRFDGRVPEPESLSGEDEDILRKTEDTFRRVDELLSRCRFRESIKTIMALCQDANRYVERKAPWKEEDPSTTIWTSLSILSNLRKLFYPFLPFTSQKLSKLLGFDKIDGWGFETIEAGKNLPEPEPLFKKLK